MIKKKYRIVRFKPSKREDMDFEKYMTVIKPALTETEFKKIIPFPDLRQLIKRRRGIIGGSFPTFVNNDTKHSHFINLIFWKKKSNNYTYLIKKRRGDCLRYHKFTFMFSHHRLYYIETCQYCFPMIGPSVRRPIHICIYFFDTYKLTFMQRINFIFQSYDWNLFKVILIHMDGKLIPIRIKDDNYNSRVYFPDGLLCNNHHNLINRNRNNFSTTSINNINLEDLCINKILEMYF